MRYQAADLISSERNMAKHSHGSMDTTHHEKVFNSFITWITRGTIAIILGLIFLWLVNG